MGQELAEKCPNLISCFKTDKSHCKHYADILIFSMDSSISHKTLTDGETLPNESRSSVFDSIMEMISHVPFTADTPTADCKIPFHLLILNPSSWSLTNLHNHQYLKLCNYSVFTFACIQ